MFSGGFGSTTNTFGSGVGPFGGAGGGTTGGSVGNIFGQSVQPQQTTGLFGGAFGTPTGSSSLFGQSTGLFSSTGSAISPFSAQTQNRGTWTSFKAVSGTDTAMKNGTSSQINTRHQCTTFMKEYENKSFEELRLEDYQLNRKGPQKPVFNLSQTPTNLFSVIGGKTGTSPFGQTSSFGQSAGATGNLFGTVNQQKPGGLFGSPATPSTSTAFGGGSTSTLGGFAFNLPTSQPQTSIFGSSSTLATSNTGLGATSSPFCFASQSQQPSLGLFGQKPVTTPTSSASPFAFTAPATNTKPLFGLATPTPSFGVGSPASTPTFGVGTSATGTTGSIFSTNTPQQQQLKPFSFSSPQQPATQPSFGTATSTPFSFSTPLSTPAITFGGGTAPTPTFGNTGAPATSTLGSGFLFPLGSNPQPSGTTGPNGFGGLFSNSIASNTSTGVTGSGVGQPLFGCASGTTSPFGVSTGFGTSGFSFGQPLSSPQLQQQQQTTLHNQSLSFPTIPFQDSNLFYNLIPNRKVEPMAKPSKPIIQTHSREPFRGKTNTQCLNSALSLPSRTSGGLMGLPPSINSLETLNSKTSSISKFHVFDGVEGDDLGITVDVLTAKSTTKKLLIKNGVEQSNSAFSFTSLYGDSSNQRGGGLVRLASALLRSTPLGNRSNLSNVTDTTGSVLNWNSDSSADIVEHFRRNEIHPSSSKVVVSEVDIAGADGIATETGSEMRPVLNEAEAQPDLQQFGKSGVICSRPGYYCKPALAELDQRMDGEGTCIVPGFEIGRENYGHIKFLEPVDLTNVNLDEIIIFRHKEVIVYPDDDNKPELGKGLNVPAEIQLDRVFPIDKATNSLLRNPEQIRAQGYEQKLRKACDKLAAEFISYDAIEGIWKFKVFHF